MNLDLAKTMRNLGIISGFEVIQRVEKCKDSDFIWPQGAEPEHHLDLALFPYLWLRLDIRWGVSDWLNTSLNTICCGGKSLRDSCVPRPCFSKLTYLNQDVEWFCLGL